MTTSRIQSFYSRLRQLWGHRKPPTLTAYVDGKEHPVTEWARAQAAANMRLKPEIKAGVVKMLQDQYGEEEGLRIAKYRYPEAWDE